MTARKTLWSKLIFNRFPQKLPVSFKMKIDNCIHSENYCTLVLFCSLLGVNVLEMLHTALNPAENVSQRRYTDKLDQVRTCFVRCKDIINGAGFFNIRFSEIAESSLIVSNEIESVFLDHSLPLRFLCLYANTFQWRIPSRFFAWIMPA